MELRGLIAPLNLKDMETIRETLEIGALTIELVVKLPYSPGIEHCITTVDGKEKWGFINHPVLFAHICYHGKFAFTLTRKEFADHINVDMSDALARLKEKTVAFLNNGYKLNEDSSWHKYAVKQRDSHLAFLPRIFQGV